LLDFWCIPKLSSSLEYRYVLDNTHLAEIDEAFREFTEVVMPHETPTVVEEDRDDDHFLACADSSAADCLVTRDPHLLKLGSYKGIPFLSPADFLTRLSPE
jgi:predicted nucleic acid-binding protein